MDNLVMSHLAAGLVIFSLALACGPVALRTQSQTKSPERVEPRYVPPPAWQSVEIGNYYLRKKKYRGAMSRFEEAATTDPDYAPAYLGLGEVYEKMGRKRDALEAYQKYLDALPSEKQAEEATSAHKAIDRLERELNGGERSQASTEKSRPSGK